jgi:hypothetical protein
MNLLCCVIYKLVRAYKSMKLFYFMATTFSCR